MAKPTFHNAVILASVVGCALVVGCRKPANNEPRAEAAPAAVKGTTRPPATSAAEPPTQLAADAPSSPRKAIGSPVKRIAKRPTLSIADVDSDRGIEERLYEDAKYLASDELQGRGIRTAGIDLAADYIAQKFKEAGLRTDLYAGTPFHPFNYGTQVVVERQELSFLSDERPWELRPDDEFRVFRQGMSEDFRLPVVFAGYGIAAMEAEYNDYESIDVRDKAVLVLRHEPRWKSPSVDGQPPLESRIARDQGDERPSTHALITTKITAAMERGAKAILLCTDASEIRVRTETNPDRDADRLLTFSTRSGKPTDIPVFHIRRTVAERLIQAAVGKSLSDLEATIDTDWSPASTALPDITVAGGFSIRRRGRQLKNVIGLLEAKASVTTAGGAPGGIQNEATEETVVIGAHYDHLGMGGAGSLAGSTRSIHNGADDNASGTVSMIEVARQLAARGPYRRRILFIAFSAEESGLIGSDRYTRAPYVPMKDTVAMLNLDMVGRLGRSMEIHGTQTAVEFNSLLDELTPKYQLRVQRYGDGYGPSDHSSFYEHGVPVLHFFTGLHKDYHRPSDDYDKLNLDGMRRITLLTRDIAVEIADADKRLVAKKSDLFDLGGLDLGIDSPPRRTVKLGVRANDVDGEAQITNVFDRTPAKQAGLRKGDVIMTVNGEAIRGAREFLDIIRKTEGGKTVTIGVKRGAVELEMDVKLGP